MTYPLSDNETERLKALKELKILGKPDNAALNALCERAARLFDVPMVAISLLDENKQWFQAQVGLDTTHTPRESAFCNHTILSDTVMVVPDASIDERFSDNPLVTGDPHIRFYAGAPLMFGEGVRLGSFCLIDRKPRSLTEDEARRLEWLADRVSGELWAHDAGANPEKYKDSGQFAPAPFLNEDKAR